MKFTIIRGKFLDALKTVQNIVPGKASMQILQNVHIEAADGRLVLMTTDLSMTVKNSVECDVEEPGKTTLPVKLLALTIAKAAEGPVKVEIGQDNLAVVSAGSAVFKIAGLPETDFPKYAGNGDSFSITVPQMALRELLRKTHYAAWQEEGRNGIRGVLMSLKEGKLTMVATDGRRLALAETEVDIPAGAETDITLPIRSISELLRILGSSDSKETVVYLRENYACFAFGNVEFTTKLVADPYPDYRQVIPQDFAQSAVIDRQLFIEAIERASVMFIDSKNPTHLVFADNQLIVSSGTSELGEARDIVPIKYAGERVETSFDPVFLLEPLKAIDDNEITMEMNNGVMPFAMKCSIPFLYVIMPLRYS